MGSQSSQLYKPSWVDKVVDLVERLPLPSWFVYLLLYAVEVLIIHFIYWIDGSTGWGEIRVDAILDAIWIPLSLSALHYLNAVARKILKEFRPMMECEDDEFNRLFYRMVTMPNRVILTINAALIIIVVVVGLTDPSNLDPDLSSPFALFLLGILGAFGFSFPLIFIYHTIRQLRLVNTMYTMVKSINIFNLQPLYSLSGLTSKTGMVWIVFMNLFFIINVVLDPDSYNPSFLIPFLTVEMIFAIMSFVLPLWGIHIKIEKEKDRMLAENSQRVEKAYKELERRMDENDLEGMPSFQVGASGLITFRNEIAAISTWPWQPRVFRGFLSAVFLPIFLWLIQQFLSGVID